jgi:hypothetical protein
LSLKIAAIVLLSLCSAAATASACQRNGNALLDDNFKNPDPGWGQPDKIAAFAPTGLALTPPVSGRPGGGTPTSRWPAPISASR